MDSKLLSLSDIPLSYAAVGTIAIYVLVELFRDRHLQGIPGVGYTFPILNWITGVQYLFQARKLIQEGYEKYQHAGAFRIAAHDGWLVIVTNPKLVEEVRRAPDDTLDFVEAVTKTLEVHYTLGSDTLNVPYHVDVVRTALTRNLNARFDDIWDEIQTAFSEEISAGNDWKEMSAIKTIQLIVSRVSNRLFVNLPLCRDREWIQLNIDYTTDIAISAMVLKITPAPLKAFMSRIFAKTKAERQLATKLVGPIIAERLNDLAEKNERWENRPNDLITWLIEACPLDQRTIPLIANRLLVVNFAAIHTSSMTFSNVIYRLAANPEWAAPMREEVERIVAAEGWSKLALTKMRRVDSFIRETQRVQGISMLSLQRWTVKPFTFSNGLCVPPGYVIHSAAEMLHTDSAHHGEHAAEFDPWRWAEIREDDTESLKHQMVATTSTLLHFGHGKHACPGRFFAANELKAMLAHLVLEYDVRFKEGETRPPSVLFGANIVPPPAQLEFRKRQVKA